MLRADVIKIYNHNLSQGALRTSPSKELLNRMTVRPNNLDYRPHWSKIPPPRQWHLQEHWYVVLLDTSYPTQSVISFRHVMKNGNLDLSRQSAPTNLTIPLNIMPFLTLSIWSGLIMCDKIAFERGLPLGRRWACANVCTAKAVLLTIVLYSMNLNAT